MNPVLLVLAPQNYEILDKVLIVDVLLLTTAIVIVFCFVYSRTTSSPANRWRVSKHQFDITLHNIT